METKLYKIQKEVGGGELERETMRGWCVISAHEVDGEFELLEPVTPDEQQQPRGYGYPQTGSWRYDDHGRPCRVKKVIGRKLRFVLGQEEHSVLLAKESEITKRDQKIAEQSGALDAAREREVELEKQLAEIKARLGRFEEKAISSEREIEQLRTTNRRLEADLAKARRHFGERDFKAALDAK